MARLMSFNMLMWLTMLTLFAAILCLAAAACMAMAKVLAPALAVLFTGLGLLLLVVVLAFAIRTATHATAAAESGKSRPEDADAQHAAPAGIEAKAQWVDNNQDIAIAGALALGVALVASSGLRRTLVRAAGPVLVRSVTRAVSKGMKRS